MDTTDVIVIGLLAMLGIWAASNWQKCSTQSQVICNGVIQPASIAAMQGCTNTTVHVTPTPSCLFSLSL